MDGFLSNRVGEKFITSEGYEFEIIEYYHCENCTIKFKDDTIIYNKTYFNISKGRVKNPNYPSVFGVGYIGVGKYCTSLNKKCYKTWSSVLQRCYSKQYHEKYPTYKDVIVCEEWHNFQNFAKWFEENYNYEIMQGWHLDKDILMKSDKIYSPETCCFVPPEINTVFLKNKNSRGDLPIGVSRIKNKYRIVMRTQGKRRALGYYNTIEEAFHAYKTAKENYLKELADKWKDKIDLRVYNLLINYKVKITD